MAGIHAVRVELIVRYVMPAVLPVTGEQPFQFWYRNEWGPGGNPHTHGKAYAAGNRKAETTNYHSAFEWKTEIVINSCSRAAGVSLRTENGLNGRRLLQRAPFANLCR